MENSITLANHIQQIKQLLLQNNYPVTSEIKQLKSSGSERVYFRLSFKNKASVLAAYNADAYENQAWLYFSKHFHSIGLPVPEIFAQSEDFQYFLLEYLGDETLFDLLGKIPEQEKIVYFKKAISALIRFQVDGIKGLDWEKAYPVKDFNKKSILWDLNYFKYYFVKTHNIAFDENKLEDDFQRFADILLEAESQFFLYRDFQSRNIMVRNGNLFFIDFQAGRKGPLQYDLVSLLFQARANLNPETREILLHFYLDELEKKLPGRKKSFLQYYNNFIYFRLMQVLGAYGFRGIIQKKTHFLLSIPFAIGNLEYLLNHSPLTSECKELNSVLRKILEFEQYKIHRKDKEKLRVEINSFSYLNSSYPKENSGNGGGFAFDCRALPNPGRIEELKDFSGLETPVIQFFEKSEKMKRFLEHVFKLTDMSVDNYLERKFSNLQVNFGCTGGKHRSVYCAEQLKMHFGEKYGDRVEIVLNHKMEKEW
ncbi:MAG TPA: RNase adapter RapZ [Bacteroidales bacterium]